MNKEKIIVPKGVRYISEWEGYKLFDYPHIINKQIPGCGFTEWCLTNNEDIILCSPRKILLENKRDQHCNDVLYINGSDEDTINVDKDLARETTKAGILSEEEKKLQIEKEGDLYKKVLDDIELYIRARIDLNKPKKILVTYDSFKLVKDAIKCLGMNHTFRIIIDEFQSIFIDSKFKSSTEMKFLNCLEDVQKVCYVSATPMIDEYLELMDEFKDLPYYDLDWETDQPGRIIKPKLTIRTSNSVFTTAKSIIEKYKSGNFDYKYVKDSSGNTTKIESREAVIYVNSVNNIVSIIKNTKLSAEECNILCARTSDNKNKLSRKLGKEFKIGRVPLRGEEHKMFTFCTRTVYLGADFYSTNAKTFIISDANIDSLSVDISLDLPQILGRQRLEENPWKGEAAFFYRPRVKSKTISKEEFNKVIENKMAETNKVLKGYSELSDEAKASYAIRCEFYSKLNNYKYDYIAINSQETFKGSGIFIQVPVLNRLVLLAEKRAFDIQQIDYADRFMVFNLSMSLTSDDIMKEVMKILEYYESLPRLFDKLKFLCELDQPKEIIDALLYNITEKHFVEYYTILGPERCKALGYNVSLLNKELGIISFNRSLLILKIFENFKVSEKYSLSDIKDRLREIYINVGYNKNPMPKDLEEFFDIREITMYVLDDFGAKKRARGYELLSKKGGQP